MICSSNDVRRRSFGSLLSSTLLCVPPFQRRYCWGTDHWRKLLRDVAQHKSRLQVRRTLGQDQQEEAASAYDFGHSMGQLLVHVEEEAGDNGGANSSSCSGSSSDASGAPTRIAVIIDGQQRVTTLLLLIAALRDFGRELTTHAGAAAAAAAAAGAVGADGPRSASLLSQTLENTARALLMHGERPRLELTALDRQAFARAVGAARGPGGTDPISGAKAFFLQELRLSARRLAPEHRMNFLAQLLGGVLRRFNFLVFEVVERELHTVYHRMAIREEFLRPWFAVEAPGVAMTAVDLSRNHLLSLAKQWGGDATMYYYHWMLLETTVVEVLEKASPAQADGASEMSYNAALGACLAAFLDAEGSERGAASPGEQGAAVDPAVLVEPPAFTAFKAWCNCGEETCKCHAVGISDVAGGSPPCLKLKLRRLVNFAREWRPRIDQMDVKGTLAPSRPREQPRPTVFVPPTITKDTPKFATTLPPWLRLMNR